MEKTTFQRIEASDKRSDGMSADMKEQNRNQLNRLIDMNERGLLVTFVASAQFKKEKEDDPAGFTLLSGDGDEIEQAITNLRNKMYRLRTGHVPKEGPLLPDAVVDAIINNDGDHNITAKSREVVKMFTEALEKDDISAMVLLARHRDGTSSGIFDAPDDVIAVMLFNALHRIGAQVGMVDADGKDVDLDRVTSKGTH